MGFLFPLFLWAGLALAIPVLIHLFNLRRYKKISFPDTRFLRNIQLSTRRQAKIRNWRLLAMRMLFLAALIVAFAQPYFGGNGLHQQPTVIAIYVDNSYSMTLGQGQEHLLQKAKNKAAQLIMQSDMGAHFLLLTNDKMAAMRPLLRNDALEVLQNIKPVAKISSIKNVMASILAAQQNDKGDRWAVYLFSDFQKGTFIASEDRLPQLANTTFYFYPLNVAQPANLFIDTAYFLSPVLDTRQANSLVVRVKQSGASTEDRSSNLQVRVGEQVRAVSAIEMKSDSIWLDTLSLQLNGTGWQQITIALQDHPLSFDDTFRIAARTAPNLSVLVVADQPINPYLQAAFRTYDGFKVTEESIYNTNKQDWVPYNLILLQNISTITPSVQLAVRAALDRGQNVLLFPGNIASLEAFNQSLKAWGDIRLAQVDTTKQQVVALQQAHPLLQDLFEKVPENVQLPTTLSRYPVSAALNANQQSLMTFRDGKPFLAQYTLGQGKLFLCASGLDERNSTFAVSYFFVPLLYKMAMQSGGSNIYAVSVGNSNPIWLPGTGTDSRSVWHLKTANFDIIPSQRPSGSGVEIFVGNAAKEAGFYQLQHEGAKDSIFVGLNANRKESILDYADKKRIEQLLQPQKIEWLTEQQVAQQGWHAAAVPFPIWKIAVIIALLCLGVETYLLLKKNTPSATVNKIDLHQ